MDISLNKYWRTGSLACCSPEVPKSQTQLSDWRTTTCSVHCRPAGGSARAPSLWGPGCLEKPHVEHGWCLQEREETEQWTPHWLPPESHTWPSPSHSVGESWVHGCTQLQQVRKSNHMMCLGKSDTLRGQNCPSDHDCKEGKKKQSKGAGIWGGGLYLIEMVRNGLSDVVTSEGRPREREREWVGVFLQRI